MPKKDASDDPEFESEDFTHPDLNDPDEDSVDPKATPKPMTAAERKRAEKEEKRVLARSRQTTPEAEPEPTTPQPRKVRATRDGYLGHVFRHAGDVFIITQAADQKFSSTWMEDVPDNEPEKITTAQKAINREIRDLNKRDE